MKRASFQPLLASILLLSVGLVGCRKGPKAITDIPGQDPATPTAAAVAPPEDTVTSALPSTTISTPRTTTGGSYNTSPPSGPGFGPGSMPVSSNTTPLTSANLRPANGGDIGTPPENAVEDREIFRSYNVYFDYDRHNVKPDQQPKIEFVANHLKNNPNHSLRIEGNCDERGTSEYNRALGERRAIAARDALVALGVESARLTTVSFGEDNPADPGTTEAAFALNRRDEFVVLKP